MTKREIISNKAFDLLKANPDGLRYSVLLRRIKELLPEQELNTIQGTIVKLTEYYPDKVSKPSTGLFKLASLVDGQEISQTTKKQQLNKIKEEDFYQPFADYLVNELEECTKAIPLGGKVFQDKWGTPDVIGKRVKSPSDIIEFPKEIITAEIKINTNDLITAFGQCCSYKLFSHKTYLVIPKTSSEEDKDRLDSLSMIFGIGLILFDATNPKQPDFRIRTRATKLDPDMFYVNRYMKFVEDDLWK
jgi:hypothetical protein